MSRGLLVLALMAAAVCPVSADPAKPQREVRSSLEFSVAGRSSLGAIEAEIAEPGTATTERQPVTDIALFAFKPGGDVRAALQAANDEVTLTGAALFTVRLFVVMGGRLYSEARGQCGGWESDVAHCTVGCDAGLFAVRRNGSAALELLVGAIPGGTADDGGGVTISTCGFDEAGDVKLVPKTARGLAIVGFDSN